MVKNKNKKNSIEPKKEEYKPTKLTLLVVFATLIGIIALSFYIRAVIPYDITFNNGVTTVFASDDSVYHMRLVENTIKNFPFRIEQDPYTFYPYGYKLHWGPLFDQLIASASFIAAFLTNSWENNLPSLEIINKVGAYTPAVMGVLVIIPVFFILKLIHGYKAALLGALLIAVLPGQFLNRSILGFTDNHVAEVLFTSFAMMFLLIALHKSQSITFSEFKKFKAPLIFSILFGISLGAYLQTWTNGLLFVIIISIAVFIQLIISHIKKTPTEPFLLPVITGFIITLLMVLPYVRISNGFQSGYYSLLHISLIFGTILIFLIINRVSKYMQSKQMGIAHFILFILASILLLTIAINLLFPEMYDNTFGRINYVLKGHIDSEGAGMTIAEAKAPDKAMLIGNFGYNYYFAFFGMFILLYYLIKKQQPVYTVLLTWNVFILIITLAQVRFAYYYSVNVAILVALFAGVLLNSIGWRELKSEYDFKFTHLISIAVILWLFVLMPVNGANIIKQSFEVSKGGSITYGYFEWFEALNWMRYNTPEPSLPYNSDYKNYNYSEKDYGVMSWWDYGHVITYWGHRIPNANPFQAGIGGGLNHESGASTFLTAPDEDSANSILNKLGNTKYVITNAYMGYAIFEVFLRWNYDDPNKYYTVLRTSNGNQVIPSPLYYSSMSARLHILDANSLKNYRLIYESAPNPNTPGGAAEKPYKVIYDQFYDGNLPIEESGYVKIFERVKGAKIAGLTKPGDSIIITTQIKTNRNRAINYKQSTTATDIGDYELTVPHANVEYTITANNQSKKITISEDSIVNGDTIKLNFA